MSTRPDSVARLALEDGAGERDCPNRVLDATDGRLTGRRTVRFVHPRTVQPARGGTREATVQGIELIQLYCFSLKARAAELSLSDAPPRTKVPESGAGST